MGDLKAGQPLLNIDEGEAAVLRSFVACEVRYLIIGGRAVQFHGHVRPAKDLDLLVEFSGDNWQNLQRALRPLNGGVPPFETLSAEKRYQARLNFYPTVELLTAVDGVPFAQAWQDAVETVVENMPVRVISRANLITCKQASKRALDVQDVAALRDLG